VLDDRIPDAQPEVGVDAGSGGRGRGLADPALPPLCRGDADDAFGQERARLARRTRGTPHRLILCSAIQAPAVVALGLVLPALALLVFALRMQAEALESTGLLLTIGFSLEMLSLGLATCATCRKYRWSVIKSLISVVGVGLLLVIGAGLAATLLQNLTGAALGGVLAFGLAALLYLVTGELLVEAHEVRENTATTAMFFVGFLTLLMVDVLT